MPVYIVVGDASQGIAFGDFSTLLIGFRIWEFMVDRIRLVQGAKHSHSHSYGAYLQRSRRRILTAENLKF